METQETLNGSVLTKTDTTNTIKSFLGEIINYNTAIIVLPLLGYIASTIYSTTEAITWYDSIKFYIPDILTQTYGLYVNAFFFILLGIALSQLASIPTQKQDTLKSYIIWLIPVIFLMVYIANPIMYQTQSLIAPGVIYTISVILACFVLYYIYAYNKTTLVKIVWIAFIIWMVYLAIFFYTGGSGGGRLATVLGFKMPDDICNQVVEDQSREIQVCPEVCPEVQTCNQA